MAWAQWLARLRLAVAIERGTATAWAGSHTLKKGGFFADKVEGTLDLASCEPNR